MVKDFTAVLSRKENLAPNVWGFTFDIQDDILEFKAGQYVLLKIDGQYRQFSISSTPQNTSQFDLIVEFFEGGLASTFLRNLEIGQPADFKGPAGIFVLNSQDIDKVFLVTGTGIAPVKSMIDSYLESGGTAHVQLYFGLKTKNDMYLYDHFVDLVEKYQNFEFKKCLSREENLGDMNSEFVAMGRVNEVYSAYMNATDGYDPKAHEFYLCGSQKVVESLKEYVVGLGVPKENMHFENFG